MNKYRWWIGIIVMAVAAVGSLGYSYSQESLYQGEVSFRLGRLPNIEAITRVGSLTHIGKGVWRLFEKKDTQLIVSRSSAVKVLENAYGNESSPTPIGFVFRVQTMAPDVVKVTARGASPENVVSLISKISSDLISEHEKILQNYLAVLEGNRQAIQLLIDEVGSDWISNAGLPNAESSTTLEAGALGYALLWEKRAELVLEKERLKLWSLPPNAYSTVQLGKVVVSAGKIKPKILEHLIAILIIGLAVALALPIGLGFFESTRKR